MVKFIYVFKETLGMIKRHRLYFLAPLLIMLVILALIVFYVGPSVITMLFYAGI